jgi:hypothetical protein
MSDLLGDLQNRYLIKLKILGLNIIKRSDILKKTVEYWNYYYNKDYEHWIILENRHGKWEVGRSGIAKARDMDLDNACLLLLYDMVETKGIIEEIGEELSK